MPDLAGGAIWLDREPKFYVYVDENLAIEFSHFDTAMLPKFSEVNSDPTIGGKWRSELVQVVRILLQ